MTFEEQTKLGIETNNLPIEKKAALFDLLYGYHETRHIDSDGKNHFLNSVKMCMDLDDFKNA